MLTTVKFAKMNPNAKIPSKRDEDAGYDIYPCFEEDYITIYPHETKIISTGICSAFDVGYVALLKERGSTGTKGMGQRSGVIDSGYRGEWMVPITNTTSKIMIISKLSEDETLKDYNLKFAQLMSDYCVYYPYTKAISQAIFFKIPETEVEEYTVEEILKIPSERGIGKLGSSGK